MSAPRPRTPTPRGSSTGVHRFPPHAAPHGSRGPLHGARVPPMDSGDDPQNIVNRVGQFFVSPPDQFLVAVDIVRSIRRGAELGHTGRRTRGSQSG